MALINTLHAASAMSSIIQPSFAMTNPNQNLVLADCGIGTNPLNESWSTSRQMNWYKGSIWPSSDETGFFSPDMMVEMPYGDGEYPWNFKGASATFSNGETWSAWIEDGTPEPLRAGKAMSTKDGSTTLWCYTYRGRPVGPSATGPTSCQSAFVCNHREDGPTPWSVGTTPDNGTVFTVPPAPPANVSFGGILGVKVDVSPRPAVWYGTINHFLSSIIFTTEGICSPNPFANRMNSSVITRCKGSYGTPLNILPVLFNVFKNLGSLPASDGLFFHNHGAAPFANDTSDDTVVLPTTFNLTVTDTISGEVKGYMGYEMMWPERSLGIHCNECNNTKFNDAYNSAIASAFQALHPIYSEVIVESQCTHDVLCW
ncbi:unnamed protein product [Colletotrichum noveboracense]|uniref:Uncharacterized protein n=1 Tax=Colletotrichum noveboracense TaxID=2664923 RepID=A0A9W4S4G7_9PEZI|nr:hypothetical protein K456DRAFT_1717796 [Colletotrichum gloeosporioides 23]KAJ0273097.1 hypothetical protein COL940_010045 [Colletotrichum noveboracense]KAJ0303297.1 hypothetical protein Brms1b_011695 [Colletotrichum noveboracense]CAI0653050.1 unnamed protein product [Colletotrichum noveboracense]